MNKLEREHYHFGQIAYCITKHNNLWLFYAIERNTELDGLNKEVLEDGRLNDHQIQDMNAKIAAKLVYDEIGMNDQGAIIRKGLLLIGTPPLSKPPSSTHR
jgi:hypothetical protein